ncbi:MAG: hypothetical protein WCA20_25270, partial [Candidatus Sulfotelmatobacter sp.]
GSSESRRAGVQGGSAANVIHHGDTETPSKLLHEKLTERVIGADAIPLELKCSEHILPVHEAQLLIFKTNQQAGWTHPEFQGFGSDARWSSSNRSLILTLRASVPAW